jgi:hypothetical protein
MWEWLSDTQVQKTLGFVGGGAAAVIAAGWAVVKFWSSKPKAGVVVTADRGGMAAGRDINTVPPPAAPKRRR